MTNPNFANEVKQHSLYNNHRIMCHLVPFLHSLAEYNLLLMMCELFFK